MLDRDRIPSGLLQRIVRIEEQLRLLRLRSQPEVPVDEWHSLTPYLNTTDFLGEGDEAYYIDRDRVWFRGTVSAQRDGAETIFTSSMPDEIRPANRVDVWLPAYTSLEGWPGWFAVMWPPTAFIDGPFIQPADRLPLEDPQTNAALDTPAVRSSMPKYADLLSLDGISWRLT